LKQVNSGKIMVEEKHGGICVGQWVSTATSWNPWKGHACRFVCGGLWISGNTTTTWARLRDRSGMPFVNQRDHCPIQKLYAI
jgi:hypothetical protein